jgi:hypothetical protein
VGDIKGVEVVTRTGSGTQLPPPDVIDNAGGGGGRWTVLTVARGRMVAHLIRGLLESEGIEVVLDTSNPAPGAWLMPFGDQNAPVKVLVLERQLEWARLALAQAEQEAGGAITGRPLQSRTIAVGILLGVVLLVLAFVEIFGSPTCGLGIFCP